ncbi:nitroreductase/quinone reductase family protein [Actinomadura formosensis]|uniref:nitroreductase/quinone reductase family protein n=1 Tax=Actinomadura formosensis TaxID=60706 RepID=UPI0009FD8ECE|nr:nitroreductase/quinone reductase family protein [Actinomadura formosensis]
MRLRERVANPVVGALLRSRAHRLLSGSGALITVTGRRTGRPYTLPVVYARRDGGVYVLVRRSGRKTWWRNLRRPAAVRLLIAGREQEMVGEALACRVDAGEGARGHRRRFPRNRLSGGDAVLVRLRARPVAAGDGPAGRTRRIVVARYGGPEAMRLVEEPLPMPCSGEVRVKRVAAGVSFADVLIREGGYPGGPRPPLTPGYDLLGTVDAVGEGVTGLSAGQRVAALTVFGAYADHVCVPAPHLVPVPADLDPAEAVALVLNYVTAHQMLHRVAKAREGERVLVHGAAGGVGTAALELGRLAGLHMYGTAGGASTEIVSELGAHAIDYTREDFAQRVRQLAPRGIDVVLDGIGGRTSRRSYRLLRPGGRLVMFGHYASLRHGRRDLVRALEFYAAGALVFARAALPGAPTATIYQVAEWRDRRPDWYRADLTALFDLLAGGRLSPVIAERAPLEDAPRLHEQLGRGQVVGKQILC